jgi:hypothetical protein
VTVVVAAEAAPAPSTRMRAKATALTIPFLIRITPSVAYLVSRSSRLISAASLSASSGCPPGRFT